MMRKAGTQNIFLRPSPEPPPVIKATELSSHPIVVFSSLFLLNLRVRSAGTELLMQEVGESGYDV